MTAVTGSAEKRFNAISATVRPMETLRDKVVLDEMWSQKKAPWKKW